MPRPKTPVDRLYRPSLSRIQPLAPHLVRARSALAIVHRRLESLSPPRWIREPQVFRRPMDPLPGNGNDQVLRVLTLNIAHGRKLAAHQALLARTTLERNLEEIGSVLASQEPHVVALQEADGPSAWSGEFDHVETLARLAGHDHFFRGEHNHFGLGRANLASGTALTAALELSVPESHRFDTSWRDTKGFVITTVEPPGWSHPVDLVSVHLEALHPAHRRRQIRLLAHVLARRTHPLVILGDFNASWCEEATQFLPLTRLGLRAYQPYHKAPTFPSVRPWRRIDWILASRELEFVGYQTLPDSVSDHLGVVAEIQPARSASTDSQFVA